MQLKLHLSNHNKINHKSKTKYQLFHQKSCAKYILKFCLSIDQNEDWQEYNRKFFYRIVSDVWEYFYVARQMMHNNKRESHWQVVVRVLLLKHCSTIPDWHDVVVRWNSLEIVYQFYYLSMACNRTCPTSKLVKQRLYPMDLVDAKMFDERE